MKIKIKIKINNDLGKMAVHNTTTLSRVLSQMVTYYICD